MTEPFLLRALLAGLGLAVVAAPLGCFIVWQRMAYFGETIAQAGLLGVALALLFSINVTVSVFAVTLVTALLLLALSRQRILPFDSLLGLIAHAALAIGIIAASRVRGPQFDLMSFLFGDIFAITSEDLRWIYIGGTVALAALVWIWKPMLSLSVHGDLAAAEGVSTLSVRAVFVLILAFVIAIAMKVVGVLLTIAFLIMPAAAARPFSESPEQMAFFAIIFAMLSVALGLFVSVSFDAPGGPSIVLMLSMVCAIGIVAIIARPQN
jgi:zinc transport system permease protein